MARITVDDCLEKIGDENRFSLVHLAVERIKQRRQGASLLITTRKNKEVVMALREIAAGAVTFDNLRGLPKLEADQADSDASESDDSNKKNTREAA